MCVCDLLMCIWYYVRVCCEVCWCVYYRLDLMSCADQMMQLELSTPQTSNSKSTVSFLSLSLSLPPSLPPSPSPSPSLSLSFLLAHFSFIHLLSFQSPPSHPQVMLHSSVLHSLCRFQSHPQEGVPPGHVTKPLMSCDWVCCHVMCR